MSDRDYAAIAAAYTRDVLSGSVPACKWVRLACERQARDLSRVGAEGFPWVFDAARAGLVCAFVEQLPHIKGEWARRREAIRLEPWQTFVLTTVFGWVDPATRLRRFRQVYLEVPRKNAKSTLSAAIGLYMLTADGEHGAEVYSAATTRDQARIVWQDAQHMVQRSAGLRRAFGVATLAHAITRAETASRFAALSAEGNTLDGLNVHFAILDELHAHRTRAVYDVLETATGARAQPLLWSITTAGSNRAGIAYEVRGYLCRVLDRVVEDDSFFGVVYSIDEGDDWQSPAAWRKANPNFGVSVYADDLETQARKAGSVPGAVNTFLTKRLNVWVNADAPWMDMAAWDRCADPALSIEQFAGEPCIVAFDLASKIDLAARVAVFWRPGDDGALRYYAFARCYAPEAAVERSENSQYAGWVREGRLIATPGNVIDFGRIGDELLDLSARHQVLEVPYDPWQATQWATELAERGAPVVELRPTVQNFSEPMKSLEALVLGGRLAHDGDPCLGWQISNVVCHYDAKDNVYPRKERPELKIDAAVALLMALNRALLREPETSVYETRGVLTFGAAE